MPPATRVPTSSISPERTTAVGCGRSSTTSARPAPSSSSRRWTRKGSSYRWSSVASSTRASARSSVKESTSSPAASASSCRTPPNPRRAGPFGPAAYAVGQGFGPGTQVPDDRCDIPAQGCYVAPERARISPTSAQPVFPDFSARRSASTCFRVDLVNLGRCCIFVNPPPRAVLNTCVLLHAGSRASPRRGQPPLGPTFSASCGSAKQRSGAAYAFTPRAVVAGWLLRAGIATSEDAKSVARYIVKNPVRAGLVQVASDYAVSRSDVWENDELVGSWLVAMPGPKGPGLRRAGPPASPGPSGVATSRPS